MQLEPCADCFLCDSQCLALNSQYGPFGRLASMLKFRPAPRRSGWLRPRLAMNEQQRWRSAGCGLGRGWRFSPTKHARLRWQPHLADASEMLPRGLEPNFIA